jgi:hypothetical protein
VLDFYFIAEEEMTTSDHARAFLAEIKATVPEVRSCPLTGGMTSIIWLNDGRRIDAQFGSFTPLREIGAEEPIAL